MHSPSRLGSSLLILALSLGSTLGLATLSHAFTFFDPIDKLSKGFPAADGPSDTGNRPRYTVSDDGCFIVFSSSATNLAVGQSDGNGVSDVFLYSCETGDVTLVSHADGDPNKAADRESDQPVISPDGEFVVFRSRATNIVPERDTTPPLDYNGQTNVFLWTPDRFWLVSHKNGDALEPGDRDSQNGVIRSRALAPPVYVAFESLANNLVDTQASDISEIFRFRLGSGDNPVDLVSVPNLGLPYDPLVANGGSFNPAISGPGLCIVYESEATNLVSDKVTDDVNGARRDIFRWADPRATILLSHRAAEPSSGTGALTGNGESTEPSIDDVCERFAFKSFALDLHGDAIGPTQVDLNNGTDVFHAGNSGNAVLASHVDTLPDTAGSDRSESPILSRDGSWLAYASMAKDLSPGQDDPTSPSSDVFAYNVARNESTLVSHTALNDRTVASDESFAPEISNDGFYVAYESDAKDLDPNQNDGNTPPRDVFLYNRRWNNSILASHRYASIAITGNRGSSRPALSGDGLSVVFTSQSDNHIADDPETGGLDDVYIFRSIAPDPRLLHFMSVRSVNDSNVIEWLTPSVNYVSMQAFVQPPPCPTNFASAGLPLGLPVLRANTIGQFTDPNTYGAGTDLCYSIFVEMDSGPILSTQSPSQTILTRTLEDGTGAVKWASNLSGFSALTQVGIGPQNLIAVANDGGVFGLTRGALSGGFWPTSYRPFRASILQPIQGRPPIVALSVMGSTRTTFVGSHDGRVYAFDADRGAKAGGALWYTSPVLGDDVQSGIAGMFTIFGGVANHLLVGTRNSSAPAQFFDFDPLDGKPKPGSPFIGGGVPIGAINTTASVDYALRQVYFASLEFTAGTDPSLWCVELTTDGFGASCWAAPITSLGGISGGPVERSGRVYVGNDAGFVHAFNAATGLPLWGPFTNCGGTGIKSFVLADRQGTAQDLFYVSSAGLCAITDTGTPVSKWVVGTGLIPAPSPPLLVRIGGVAYIYVGSSDGRLYQVNVANPFLPGGIKSVLVRSFSTIGAPAFDVLDNMIYVGSDAGLVYAVQAPF